MAMLYSSFKKTVTKTERFLIVVKYFFALSDLLTASDTLAAVGWYGSPVLELSMFLLAW